MSDTKTPTTSTDDGKPSAPAPKKRRRWWRRISVGFLMILFVGLIAGRIAMPRALQWYVNRTLDKNVLYDGTIGDIDVHLWRGAYSIEDVKLIKTTGNVAVPLFSAERVDLAIQWDALVEGRIVGRIALLRPELNFVDSEEESEDQTGAGGPWLEIIQNLFPFRINSALVHDGRVSFRAFDSDPPVDVYLSQLEASIENLGNIYDEVTPLVATVKAQALAMDQARFEYQMKLDPTSYRPTFQVALRLLGLDVTKTNSLMRAYGAFDFEHGFFDLVVELDAKEGSLEGYVKPLFRDLRVVSLRQDIAEDNVVQFFWESLVGFTTELLENQPRDQFATVIPLRGDMSDPNIDLLAILGNVLRNAFIRAYLPRLHGEAETIESIEFGPGSITEPLAGGSS